MLTLKRIFRYVLILAVTIWACAGKNEDEKRTEGCSGTCPYAFKCNPYYKDLVWSLGTSKQGEIECHVSQNGCIFQQLNCDLVNNCLKARIPVDKNCCQKFCPTCTEKDTRCPVCASFSYVAPNGTNSEIRMDFKGMCALKEYACKNATAIMYSSYGKCKTTKGAKN